jgi:transposase-like protein
LEEKARKKTYIFKPPALWHFYTGADTLERIMREIRRRTRVVGAFPDGESALMLVAARLRHVSSSKWGTRRYMNMDRLQEQSKAIA